MPPCHLRKFWEDPTVTASIDNVYRFCFSHN